MTGLVCSEKHIEIKEGIERLMGSCETGNDLIRLLRRSKMFYQDVDTGDTKEIRIYTGPSSCDIPGFAVIYEKGKEKPYIRDIINDKKSA